ncbi:hypothetical protein DFH06DRAFT_1427823 [Mycena polygramma]|nr:hypothetical protein DFH06DRAFT_1427823 [Mycena polygramma]
MQVIFRDLASAALLLRTSTDSKSGVPEGFIHAIALVPSKSRMYISAIVARNGNRSTFNSQQLIDHYKRALDKILDVYFELTSLAFMATWRHANVIVGFLWLMVSPARADCLTTFKSLRATGGHTVGGMDNHGNPVIIANATAMSYALCVKACGSGPTFRTWSVFAQRYGSNTVS